MKPTNPQKQCIDQIPQCHSAFFRNNSQSKFVQVHCSRSFSKSTQKKLKLIKDHKSLEKFKQFMEEKRKIKPLRIKLSQKKQQHPIKTSLCSIKNFKMKINKITQQSKAIIDQGTIPTLNSQSTQIIGSGVKVNQPHFDKLYKIASQKASENITPQTLNTEYSLVIKQNKYGVQSLLNSLQNGLFRKSQNSGQVSSTDSPTNKIYKQSIMVQDQSPFAIKSLQNIYKTPTKQPLKQNSQCHISTQASKHSKYNHKSKQKLTLNMARKVQTFETIKTQNDVHYSFIEQNQYSKILNKVAYPDHFSKRIIQPIKLTL